MNTEVRPPCCTHMDKPLLKSWRKRLGIDSDMKNKMVKSSLAALFISAVLCLGFIWQAEAAKWPERAHAVVELQVDSVFVKPDGSYQETEEVTLRVVDEKGRRDLQVQQFNVNTHYTRFRIEAFEVIRPDGTRVPVDLKRSMKEESSSQVASMNIYDPALRVVKVFIPDLRLGDRIRYKVVYDTFKTMIPGHFFGRLLIQGPYPVKELRITIDVPEGMEIRHLIKNDLSAGQEGSVQSAFSIKNGTEGRRLLSWTFTHVPEIVPEPYMPSVSRVAMRLLFSSLRDWAQVGRWYYRLVEPKIAVDQEIRQKVEELTDGLEEPMDRIKALFFFVARKIRYMGIIEEANRPGFEPHDIRLTFRRRYGVCRDKAALLVGMLRAAGFRAAPVIISAGTKLDPEIPVPNFNHAIAAVLDLPEGPLFMDPTDETTIQFLPDYEQDSSCIIAASQGSSLLLTPVNPPDRNRYVMTIHERIGEDGTITGRFKVETSGFVDTVFRSVLMNRSRQEQEQFLRRFILERHPEAVVQEVGWKNLDSREHGFTFSARFTIPVQAAARGKGASYIFPLGSMEHDGILEEYILDRKVSMTKRRYPLKVGYAFATRLEEHIEGADGIRMEPGRECMAAGPAFEYLSRWHENGKELVRLRQLTFKEIEISPEEYPGLKALIRILDHNRYRPLTVSGAGQ